MERSGMRVDFGVGNEPKRAALVALEAKRVCNRIGGEGGFRVYVVANAAGEFRQPHVIARRVAANFIGVAFGAGARVASVAEPNGVRRWLEHPAGFVNVVAVVTRESARGVR